MRNLAFLIAALCLGACHFQDEPDVGEAEGASFAGTHMTYHLYNASSPTGFSHWLKPTDPTGPMQLKQWPMVNYPVGKEDSLSVWETSPNVPNQSGVIYAGSTITFRFWMRKTAKAGTYYPGGQLVINFEWGLQGIEETFVCRNFGTQPLTQTLQQYTITCTVPRTVMLKSTDRLAVWPLYRVGALIGKSSVSIELAMQGPAGGTGASHAVIPVATAISTTGTCAAANPNDDLADDAALNACLAGGGVVTLKPGEPGYIVDSGLQLTRPGTTFNSASPATKLVAGAALRAPMLAVADDITDYQIANLSFDGNRPARANRADCADPATRGNGHNLTLRGSSYTVEYVTSRNALCGAGIEIDGGSGYLVRHNTVTENGFAEGEGVPGGLGDGIRLTSCAGQVKRNTISDNSDVDLRVGPPWDPLVTYGCYAGGNTIDHDRRRGRVGLLVAGGNRNGSSAGGNVITSQYNQLAVGLMVGGHPFDPTLETPNVGQVTNNDITGAVIGMVVDGVGIGDIDRNVVRSVQGYRGLGGCPLSAPFIAGDFGTALRQTGYLAQTFHPGSCSPCGDGVVDAGESCDTGIRNGIGGAAACCSNSCQQNGAEVCEPGGSGGGLWPGQVLLAGESLVTPTGLTQLVYQLDGNLVLYQTGGPPLWATNTFGAPGLVRMTEDGVLRVEDATGAVLWASASADNPGARMVLAEDEEGLGDIVIYGADGVTVVWRSSETLSGGTWGQASIEQAARLAGEDSENGVEVIDTQLARGKEQIAMAKAAGMPINILLKGIRTPDAGLYNQENTNARSDVARMFSDGTYSVVLGNSNGILQANEPQWGEALCALALVHWAHLEGVPIRIISHSNGASSLGAMVEVAATWNVLPALGSVKKVAIIAPSATDVRLRHIFTAFTTWWNLDQTRIDVVYGIQDNILDLNEMFLGPGAPGVNLATGMGEMIISGAYIGAKFGGWIGAGIGAAIGFIVGLFVESPAERAKEFLEGVEDNPWWFGGWVHVSFINQSSHDLSSYARNSQLAAAFFFSQCVLGSRECVQDCTLTLTPQGPYNESGAFRWVDLGAEGGTVTLTASTPSSCAWRADGYCPDPEYPEYLGTCPGVTGDSGTANGDAVLTIEPNTGPERTITIEVDAMYRNGLTGDQTTRGYFTVFQAAAP